jgi:carboxymethylenebutenolidase
MSVASRRRPASALAFALAALLLGTGCEGSSARHAAADGARATADTASDTASYADEMAERHEDDRPASSPAARATPDTAVTGRAVTYGDSLTGYGAVPAYAADSSATDSSATDSSAAGDSVGSSSDPLPALIAAHEWWGLNDNIRKMARRLAGQGFRVLAVDLYGGRVADRPQRAQLLMQEAMSDQQAIQDNVEAAYQHLAGGHAAPQVGIIGWCFGGAVALGGMTSLPRSLDGAVVYYGSLENATRERLQPVSMPVIGFFGAEDESIPARRVRQFEETLSELGKDAEIYIYDDAGHAFANPSGERYVASAAKDAWQKTTAFLEEHLKE